MKTPQVVITPHLQALLQNKVFITVTLLLQVDSGFISFYSDSDATVSSENSEGEGPRERERERDGAKK